MCKEGGQEEKATKYEQELTSIGRASSSRRRQSDEKGEEVTNA